MAIHHKTTTFSRVQERRLLAGITALMFLLFGSLYYNLQPQLQEAQQGYADGSIVNLSKTASNTNGLQALLQKNNYVNDKTDLSFLMAQLSQKLQTNKPLENLGGLNKKAFTVPVSLAQSQGGSEYRGRVEASRMALGFVNEDSLGNTVFDKMLFEQERTAPQAQPSTLNVGGGVLAIAGTVLLDSTKKELSGVLVRLQGRLDNSDVAYYARTDKAGAFEFSNLPAIKSFNVLPMHPDYEFGSSQGDSTLIENTTLQFRAKPHRLRLFGNTTYQQLKEDKVLTVRTPDDFRSQFLLWTVLFIIAFWAVHLFWSARSFDGDTMILPLLMLLTGISVLMMFAIQDPLRDTLRGNETVQGVVGGLFLLVFLSQLNIGRWYTTQWFDFGAFWRKSTFNQIGYTWLIAAFFLTILVAFFGTGPDGSNVKVNLNLLGFSFQPSEITKYLVLLYFAGYFTANAEYLRQIPSASWRAKNSLLIFGLFGTLLGIYLVLGDMGPALVLCFTFLLFYSAARGDFGFMIFGATVYGLLLVLASKLGISYANKLPFLMVTLLYLLVWFAYGFFKKDYKESALYIVVLIAAFVFGEMIPKVGQRLASRNNMFLNLWDNETYGGDQVAHGIWALASGGISGQGLGKGFSKVMPANHTDMILPSIGEELGLLGLIAVFVCMGILLHRTLLIARRNGQPFSFYLCAGIALVIGTQFLIIASGAMGTAPLTGVSVPFLSFGRVSMILNIAAFGVVMSLSAKTGSVLEREYIQSRFDRIVASGSFTFTIGIVKFIALVLLPYQVFKASSYVVRPAIVVNRNGERIFSINPRINILTRKLEAGNIYDRNGLLLATSNKDSLKSQTERWTNELVGIDKTDIENLTTKRLNRYYPFGSSLFFWTGDYNNRLLSSSGNGYFAEFSHLAQLRGFDTTPNDKGNIEITAHASHFKKGRFDADTSYDFKLTQYDYSALSPLLRAGIDSRAVATFKAQNRDIKLTVDAVLQTKLEQSIASSTAKDKRISVVMLNAQTGEVLASVVHPLPDIASLKQLADVPSKEQKFITNTTKINGKLFSETDLGMTYATAPGSTAKILTAFAALNRLGTAGAKVVYNVTENEKIRTTGPEQDPTGPVDMRRAIVKSSNIYFIRIANEHHLDPEMQVLYEAVGMRLAGSGGYHFFNDATPLDLSNYRSVWAEEVFQKNRQIYDNPRLKGDKKRYGSEFSDIAWGQGKLEASPLALGRMAGSIANGGLLQPSRFVLTQNRQAVAALPTIKLAQKEGIAPLIEDFMKEQSKGTITGLEVAGKSGTPERVVTTKYLKNAQGKYLKDKKGDIRKDDEENNDAWYTFFANSPRLNNAPLVTVIRIERLKEGEGGSKQAKILANKEIMKVLTELKYFERKNSIKP